MQREDIYIDVKDSAAAKETVSAGVDEAKETTKDVPEKAAEAKEDVKDARKT